MITENQPRAAIYVRVSTRPQDEKVSPEDQEAAGRQYAQGRGYDVVGVWREVWSGYDSDERPQMARIREAARRREINRVIVFNVDRFGRHQVRIAVMMDALERDGAPVEFAAENFEDNATGRFILSAKAFAAELEREKIIERTANGMRARARAGKPLVGCRPPYGYIWQLAHTPNRQAKFDKLGLEPDPETPPIVRRMFALVHEGRPIRAIAEELTAEGIPTPTGRSDWQPSAVVVILHNPVYHGHFAAYRRRTFKTAKGKKATRQRDPSEQIRLPDSPALVPPDVWDGVQDRLKRINSRPRDATAIPRASFCAAAMPPVVSAAERLLAGPARDYRATGASAGTVCPWPVRPSFPSPRLRSTRRPGARSRSLP